MSTQNTTNGSATYHSIGDEYPVKPAAAHGGSGGYDQVGNDWSFPLFSCLGDGDECLDTWCCHYCKFGWMNGRLDHGYAPKFDWAWCCCAFCGDRMCLCMGTVGATYLLRQRLLQRYEIQESSTYSFCLVLWCGPCALCQQAREMDAHGESCGGTLCKSVPPEQVHMGQPMPPPPAEEVPPRTRAHDRDLPMEK